MNMREYPILHLDTNESKETACKRRDINELREIIQYYTQTQM